MLVRAERAWKVVVRPFLELLPVMDHSGCLVQSFCPTASQEMRSVPAPLLGTTSRGAPGGGDPCAEPMG